MFTVIVADDERRVRNTVIKKGNWEELNLKVVAQVQNGSELLAQARELIPDIIITDMKMPGLQGVELMKEISEKLPQVKMIIISGYDDFGYLKQAIKSNAIDYILKPIIQEELNGALQKAVNDIVAERMKKKKEFKARQHQPLVLESIFNKFISGGNLGEEMQNYLNVRITDRNEASVTPTYRVSVISLIDFKKVCKEEFEGDAYGFLSAVINIVDEIGNGIGKSVCIQGQDAIAVIYYNEIGNQEIILLLLRIFKALTTYLHLEAVAGTGRAYEEMEALKNSYEEAWYAVLNQNLKSKERIDLYEKVSKYIIGKPCDEQLLRQFEAALKSGDFTVINKSITAIYEDTETKKYYSISMLRELNKQVIQVIEEFTKKENIEKVSGLAELKQEIACEYEPLKIARLIMQFNETILRGVYENEDITVFAIQKYIEEHYIQKITLEDISAKFWLSKQHLLKIYKKQFGTSPYMYIMDLKIEKAKLLLIENQMKIVEIAAYLNFTDESHFSRMFKKYLGVSPREFKNQYRSE